MEKYYIWLTNIPFMYYNTEKIFSTFDNPKEIYEASENRLKASKIFSEGEIKQIMETREKFDFEKYKEYLIKNDIKFYSMEDEAYPENLLKLKDAPFGLYVIGELPKCEGVSIVGSRECTNYGRAIAKELGKELSNAGVPVISGMARGIDTYAHLGALEGFGNTYAILGTGVNVCYPTENIELYETMKERGGIISEFPIGAKAIPYRFPMRNRIISGLSRAVVVVEARKKSGSLITAQIALEQGKEVLAVPGRISDALSEGCNRLLYEGASTYIGAFELLKDLGYGGKKKNNNKIIGLAKENEVVYSVTDLLPIALEELVAKTGMETQKVCTCLLDLELMGLVYEPVKNFYARKVL